MYLAIFSQDNLTWLVMEMNVCEREFKRERSGHIYRQMSSKKNKKNNPLLVNL